jgi:hypothetical protein
MRAPPTSQNSPVADPVDSMPEEMVWALAVAEGGGSIFPLGEVVSMQNVGALVNQIHPAPTPVNPIPAGEPLALGVVQIIPPFAFPHDQVAPVHPAPAPVPAADGPAIAANQINAPPHLLVSLYGIQGVGFEEDDD